MNYENKILTRMHLRPNANLKDFLKIGNSIEMSERDDKKFNVQIKNENVAFRDDSEDKLANMMEKLINLTMTATNLTDIQNNFKYVVKACYNCVKIKFF